MLVRKLVVEFMGTFLWVFVGCGAIIAQGTLGGVEMKALVGEFGKGISPQYQPPALIAIALAFGFAVGVSVYAFRSVSFHFNPAVTLGLAVAKRFPWRYLPAYWLAQFLGALLASLIHVGGFGEGVNVNYGAATISVYTTLPTAFLTELVLAFSLMLAFMAAATDKRFPSGVEGLVLGGIVAVGFLFAGVYTGAAMNPARALAPALVSVVAAPEALRQFWLYLLASLLGAVGAAFLYEFLRPAEFAKNAPEDLVLPSPAEVKPTA